MAKSRRHAVSTRHPDPKPSLSTVDAIARPNAPIRPSRRVSLATPAAPTAWHSFVRTWLPLLLVTSVAYAAVFYEFTTAPAYIRSKSLMLFFRRAFIALVCLSNRTQLHAVYYPPHKPRTLKLLCMAHAKALLVVILANSAGTTVIQPLFGQPPAYAKTIELVVPVYLVVEIAISVLHIPTPVIHFVVGFLVSWLKAATTSTLVFKWQEDDGAHPVALVFICTCNLFASGLVLRYIAHFHTSHRIVAISGSLLWSFVQILATGGLVGLVAYVANHFSTKEERQLEATLLYFGIAWYALDKYWKTPLRAALVYYLTSEPTKTKTA